MTTSTPVTAAAEPARRSRLKRILAVVGIALLGVLALIVVLGLLPLSSRGLQSEPDPAGTYEEAVARFEQDQQAEQGIVNDASGSHLLVHGDRTPRAYVLDNPSEPRRDWVYRGEATRGVAAFLALGHNVRQEANRGARPDGQVTVVTMAQDNTANNGSRASLVDRWRQAGAEVVTFEFEPSLDIPHNSVDPGADATKKSNWSTSTCSHC